MKTFTRIYWFAILIALLSACGSKATATPFTLHFENPYAPQPGDSNLTAGEIKIDSTSVFLTESRPRELMVFINYFPPTPCYQLRLVTSGPDEKNQIQLKAYAVAPKNQACTLMALATPLQASLNLGSLPKGHYTVFLNGDQIGQLDV